MPIKPIVSVILPVYNSEEYLDDAIKSILNQTLKEFELIIIIDGCTDKSNEIALSYKDIRIKLINHKKNLGFVYRLNEGLGLAHGEYISIMNSDDIAIENKLAQQIAVLKSNKNIGLCGAWVERFGKYNDVVKHSSDHHNIVVDLFYGNPFSHPTIVFDKKLLKKLPTWYNENFATAEDLDFIQRMILITEGVNITEVLLKYRTHDSQMSEIQQELQKKNSLNIRQRFFETIFFKLNSEDLFCWNKLINSEFFEFSDTIRLFNFITKIKNTPQITLSSASIKEFIYRLEKIIYHKYHLFEKDQRVIFHENFDLKNKISNSESEIIQLNTKVEQFILENKKLLHEKELLNSELLPKVDNLKEYISSKMFLQKDVIETIIKEYSSGINKKIEKTKEEQERELKEIIGSSIKDYSSGIKEKIQQNREERDTEEKKNIENIITNYSTNIKEKIDSNNKEQRNILKKNITLLFKELNNIKLETEKMNTKNQKFENNNVTLLMDIIKGYRKDIETIQNQYSIISEKQTELNNPLSISNFFEINDKMSKTYEQYIASTKEAALLHETILKLESLINLKSKEIIDGNTKIELLDVRLLIKEKESKDFLSDIKNTKQAMGEQSKMLVKLQLSKDALKLENVRLYELIETQQAQLVKWHVESANNLANKLARDESYSISNTTQSADTEKLDALIKKISEKDEMIERLNVKNRIYQNYQENFITQKNHLEQRIKLLEDLIQHMRIKERIKRLLRFKGI